MKQISTQTHTKCWAIIASFPGRSLLQFLIAYKLQYAKTEGEGLRERVMCVTSGRREGRREGRCEGGGA